MILNRQRAVRVARRPLENFLARVRKELGLGEADVTVCLVSDAEIARMNEAYRKKKGPTDVLSFPEVERRAPMSLRRTRGGELQILILHGVLHLLGYDHETDSGEMDRVEHRLRKRLGLT